jgi:hypothetical protein
MKANLKSTRDMIGSGLALSIFAALTEYGVRDATAGLLALGAAFLLARGYRLLRARWPALGEFDPAA